MEQEQMLLELDYYDDNLMSVFSLVKIHKELEKKFFSLREAQHFQEFNVIRRLDKMKNDQDENMVKCYECEDEINKEDGLFDPDGNILCEDCYHDNYAACDHCGEINCINNMLWSESNEMIYCGDCYNDKFTKCEACGCELDINDSISNDQGDNYCSDCFYEYYSYCAGCDEIISQDYAMYDENTGNSFCESCYSEHCENEHIHSYEYKPDPDFKFSRSKEKRQNTTLYFGLELEVENKQEKMQNDEMAESVTDYIDAYCKEDGSLDNGFEIVTHPFSWQWYKDEKDNFSNLLDELSSNGFSSFDAETCGIHIHLSKRSFSTLHLFKFLKMFYDNDNYPLIKGISQRTFNSSRGGCQWGASPESVDTKDQIDIAKKKDSPTRYTAVNLENTDTVEVRIFRGTLNRGSFHKNIEFVKAMFDFTLNVSIATCNWKHFADYIKENFLTYGNLFKFMEKKNLFV